MKIKNLTPFDTDRLREIARQVADRELDSNQRNNITVHFVTSKSRNKHAKQARNVSFYRRIVNPLPSSLKYNQAIVRIPRKKAIVDPAYYAMETALLLAHEFAEMRGMDHQKMKTPRYFFRDNWQDFYAWAKELPLVSRPKEVVIPINNFHKKLQHCIKKLVAARTKEKRAITLRKKWERKLKYYQKKVNVAVERVSTPVEMIETSEAV